MLTVATRHISRNTGVLEAARGVALPEQLVVESVVR